ncbi:MAG: CoA ester lyase [Geminicoccaceae bacterium]|nr:CoA ester lyase [Geminicoccaceae bacterium]
MHHDDRPRRSVLYMPGSNPRALAKGRDVPADGLIFDLEDAVSPDAKTAARGHIEAALTDRKAYGRREIIVRTNGLDSQWGRDDLLAMARAGADAILLPKVESTAMIDAALAVLDEAGAPAGLPIWCMMETPRGILHVEEIADHQAVSCLVLGTSDLTKDMRSLHTATRLPMLPSLGLCLLAARAAGIAVLDGVHLDLADLEGHAASCRQGRELGFDGKTLIHPKQIEAANIAFAPGSKEIAWSKRIIEAWEAATAEGKGVVLVDGRLIENLHIAEARRLLALSAAIGELNA